MVGQEPPKIEKIRDILQFVEFGHMLVDEPENQVILVVRLAGGCVWELEHGIEVMIQNGEWAWGEPEHYEEDYNYAFVIKQIVDIEKESLE